MGILKKHYSAFTGLFVFIIYLITLAPSVTEIDSGELAAVQATLGIAHPTGYPLFSMLGYLFVHLPSPFSKIFMSNLLAALLCSIAVSVFTQTAKLVLDNLASFKKSTTTIKNESKKGKKKEAVKQQAELSSEINDDKKIFSALLAGLVLAFSRTFWTQSTSVEVYSLHLLLITLIIFLLVKAYLKKSGQYYGDTKAWLLFSSVLALGFSNHMTTMFILPGAAYLYFEKNRFSSSSFKKLGIMLLVFFPVLLLMYAYLPIRASQNPLMNWGNPVDLERIIRHISGKQYQVWLFSSTDSAKRQLIYFFNNLPGEFAVVSLLFIVIGLIFSIKQARKFFVFLLITFLFTVLYSINYDIVDIDSYFLLGYIALAFISIFGILRLFSILKSNKNSYLIPLSVIAVFITVEFYLNFRDVNQSNIHTYEDYTRALIQSTDKNSIIFSYQWDYFVSSAYYFQNVEQFRQDITIVDKELMRRSWYYNQLERNHPQVVNKLKAYIDPFLESLKPFERDQNFNASIIETNYRNLMTHLVSENIDEHSFYIAPEIVENEMARGEFSIPEGYELVPDLFLFRVVKPVGYVPAGNPDFKIRIPANKDKYIENIERFVGSMLVRRALYELKFNKTGKARIYINKIKKELPDYQIPYDLAQAFN